MKYKNLKFGGFVFVCILSLFLMTISIKAAKFTSVYTDTKKDCKGEEPLFTCKGYGGYKVLIGIGGVFSDARIDKGDFSLPIAQMQSVGWNPKIEWRMADGKPFAVIVRVDVNDEDSTDMPKKIGEQLVVRGLQGFESIDEAIDSKTPKANEKAREIADKGFANGGASTEDGEAFSNGKTALFSDTQLSDLGKINAAVAVSTYIPAGFKLKKLEIAEAVEMDAGEYIIAFSMSYADAKGKTFSIESNNEALGDMAVGREVKFSNSYFLDTAQENSEFYAGHDENDAKTIASEWLCSKKEYQPENTSAQCFQVLSNSKSLSPDEAMKIMQSLRYLKR